MFNRSAEKMETIVGPGVTFKGVLKAQSGVRVDGLLEGEIETTGNVIVGEKGQVIASISAQNIYISGYVKGSVAAKGRLEISGKGRLWGDMSAATLAVEEGGIFRGNSTMSHESFDREQPDQQAPAA